MMELSFSCVGIYGKEMRKNCLNSKLIGGSCPLESVNLELWIESVQFASWRLQTMQIALFMVCTNAHARKRKQPQQCVHSMYYVHCTYK